MDDPDVPLYFTEWNEHGALVMQRLDDGWCSALDRNTMLCTIYAASGAPTWRVNKRSKAYHGRGRWRLSQHLRRINARYGR